MDRSSVYTAATLIAVGASTVILAKVLTFAMTAWKQKSRRNVPIPEKWKRVGEISELTLYPLKGAKGYNVPEAECTTLGLRAHTDGLKGLRDRFFMPYHEIDGRYFQTKLNLKITLISTESKGDGKVIFRAPDAGDLTIDLIALKNSSKRTTCRIWLDELVPAIDCGDEAAAWFSLFLIGKQSGIRLGFSPAEEDSLRDLFGGPWSKYANVYTKISEGDLSPFASLVGHMILSESSLDELNSRLKDEDKARMNQFRGNLVVKGSKPYEEDTWEWIKIGENVIFRNVKPCTRCYKTTINPETCVKNPNLEPLRTLRKYRLVDNPEARKIEKQDPMFGRYLGLYSPSGFVKVGDPVYASVS